MFDFQSGKLKRKYDESLEEAERAQARGGLGLEAIDFGR